MKRFAVVFLVVAVLAAVGGALFYFREEPVPEPSVAEEQPPLSSGVDSAEPVRLRFETEAFALVEDMKVGWNLGNALDSTDHKKRGIADTLKTMTAEEYYETYWGNPVTTEKLIADVAEMGFGTVRVPVTWYDHMDEDWNISPSWLSRVAEVVDMVLENDMYCIINVHHDVGTGDWPWLRADLENIEEQSENLRKVWAQIATYFQDYGDKLLFQGFNEIQGPEGNMGDKPEECFEAVNRLNQVFVDTVRATGGKNARRFLMVNPYGAGTTEALLSSFNLPNDTAKDRLIASVHVYEPVGFCWSASKATWTTTYSEWSEEIGGRRADEILELVDKHLVQRGIPVVIGEFGAWNKNNTADRMAFSRYFVNKAAELQMSCIWWDTGGKETVPGEATSSSLYDRYNETWLFPEVAQALTEGAEAAWQIHGIGRQYSKSTLYR